MLTAKLIHEHVLAEKKVLFARWRTKCGEGGPASWARGSHVVITARQGLAAPGFRGNHPVPSPVCFPEEAAETGAGHLPLCGGARGLLEETWGLSVKKDCV